MDEDRFLTLLKEAIAYNQLARYFAGGAPRVEAAASLADLRPDIIAIDSDLKDPGGLKLSHAQRRMLTVVVALWDGGAADRLFGQGLGSLAHILQSMDRRNRKLLSEIILTYPGWGE